MKAVDPLWLLKYLPNMPNSHIAIFNDFKGPNNALTVREASSNLAIAEAYTTIERGAADIMIAGATGTRVHPVRTTHFVLQEEVSPGDGDPTQASRPFDRDRNGSVLGEGAGALILEELEHAKSRGATIWGEVVGYGSSTVLDIAGGAKIREAIRNVLRQSLRTAGWKPSDVGHIHAHGLSSRGGDVAEAEAIREVFDDAPIPVTAAKSFFGNLGAASGVVEACVSLLAMANGSLPPILNYQTPDPACPIHAARSGAVPGESFVSVNVTPLGQASAIAIGRAN
jgi:3-oxoacyl-[acyl-carrier-protein] synthase II